MPRHSPCGRNATTRFAPIKRATLATVHLRVSAAPETHTKAPPKAALSFLGKLHFLNSYICVPSESRAAFALRETSRGPSLKTSSQELVSQPWFTSDGYQRVRAALADPHKLPVDYSSFVLQAEKIEYNATHRGALTARVHVELKSFRAWCVKNRMEASVLGCRHYASSVTFKTKNGS
jgi:hypothetical protein